MLGREQEEFIHSVKAQREKDEDKKAKGTHNGQKTEVNETEISKMF